MNDADDKWADGKGAAFEITLCLCGSKRIRNNGGAMVCAQCGKLFEGIPLQKSEDGVLVAGPWTRLSNA